MKKIIIGSIILLQSFFCFSQSLNFDGIDDYLEITPFENLSDTNFTLEVWVKIPDDGNTKKMNLFSLKNCVNGFNMYLTENGSPEFTWSAGPNDENGSIHYIATSIINIKDNKWHHLAFIRNKDQDKLLISIDGSHQGTTSSKSAGYDIPLKGINLVFGENLEDDTFGRSFLGSIDELSIWKRHLSEDDLTNRSLCVSISLQDYQETFSFNEGTESADNTNITHATSSNGSKTGKLENFNLQGDISNFIDADFNCIVTPNNDVIDYGAINFDGNNDYILVLDRSLGTVKTSEVWVKIPTVGSNGLEINESVGPVLGNYPFVSYSVNAAGQPEVYWNNGEVNFAGKKDLRDNQWHHIAYVRNVPDNKFSIYIDGVEDTSFNSAGTNINSTKYLKIGGDYITDGKNGFHGTLDDIRLWPEYLTNEEIYTSMNSNFDGKKPMQDYKSWSFNIGEKKVTEILSKTQTEVDDTYYLVGFNLVGNTSNYVEGHLNSTRITDYDPIQQRIINTKKPVEVAQMLFSPKHLYGKEFENYLIFYYDKAEKSISLVEKESKIQIQEGIYENPLSSYSFGRNVWNDDKHQEDHDKMKTSTAYGTGYTNTQQIYDVLTAFGSSEFAPHKALKHDVSKKTFLPSIDELKLISNNLNLEIKKKYFDKKSIYFTNYCSSSSYDGNNYYSHNILDGTSKISKKTEGCGLAITRKIYENESNPILRVTESDGWIFQNMGKGVWVRYHPDKSSYLIFNEQINQYNKDLISLKPRSYEYEYYYDDKKIYVRGYDIHTWYNLEIKKGMVKDLNAGSTSITSVLTKLEDYELQKAVSLESIRSYRWFAQYVYNNRHKALTSAAQMMVHLLEPTIDNYEEYLGLQSHYPNEKISVEHKLDDLYWTKAKTEDTEASYKKYLDLDSQLNRNHKKEAQEAFNNYEYILYAKMISIRAEKVFDNEFTDKTLELVWDIKIGSETISDTYTVEEVDFGPNGPPNTLVDIFNAPESFPVTSKEFVSHPFDGTLWGANYIRNDGVLFLKYNLYDEDGRGKTGNKYTDRIGDDTNSSFKIKESDLEFGVTKKITFIQKEIDPFGDTEVHTTFEVIKFDRQGWTEHIRATVGKCNAPKEKNYSSKPLKGPGYLIRNETDFDLDISLDNVGPLYFGLIRPGDTFRRDTGPWQFTISAAVNFDGRPKYDDLDAIIPIIEFTIEVLSTIWAPGGALGARLGLSGLNKIRGGVTAAYSVANKSSKLVKGAKKVWLVAKKVQSSVSEVQEYAGYVIDTAEALNEFANLNLDPSYTFVDKYFTSSYFWGVQIPVYRIIGGPKKPCLNEKDEMVVIESEPLEIIGPFLEHH